MKIILICMLFITFAFGIYEMKISANISKKEWYSKLDTVNKRKVISLLQGFWKKIIICLAFIIAIALIVLSTFMGNGTRYDNLISIGFTILCGIIIIVMISTKNKFYKELNIYLN